MSKKKAILSMIEKTARIKINHDPDDWPYCAGFFHQLRRPRRFEKKET